MAILAKVEHGLKLYFYSFIFPFTQKDCIQKMWIFVIMAYLPVINLLLLRGWRFEFVHRLGWHVENPLPRARDFFKFLSNGLLLWMLTFAYLMVPLALIALFGLGGWGELYRDLVYLVELTFDFIFNTQLTLELYVRSLWAFIKNEFIEQLLAFALENIYLVLYVPIYRVAMIRFAVTKRLFHSHLSIFKNLKFIFRNFLDLMLVYLFVLLNGVVAFVATLLLSMTVVLAPVIPVFVFFMYYWSSGYEYGHLARLMVEQDELAPQAHPALSVAP
ncbi:DUF4013 domain-containing protein [Cesiribacter sp. SM1]|uniref:DUF4013 domain-containing protein n=1 Tax=Cesiribacter sp. SM1 TaxID=2861196 RepID=UPI001CD2407C|nr:DUF4013 domain-containing protein [Cesiribacter sp. SM1]